MKFVGFLLLNWVFSTSLKGKPSSIPAMDELTCEIRSSDSMPASSGDGDTTEVLTLLEDKDNGNVVCVNT